MPGLTFSFVVALALCGQVASPPPANGAPPVAGPAAGGEAPAPSQALAGQVARAVRQLDAAALVEREAAESQLIGLGAAALELLPKGDDPGLSAESRKRLARVRRRLETLKIEQLTQAAMVTLPDAAMPLGTALATIEQQTGNKVIDFREQFGQEATAKEVRIGFTQIPFWEALDRLLDQTQLGVYAYSGEEGVALVERAPNATPRLGHCAYVGAFRLEPLTMTTTRNLRELGIHRLTLAVEIAWEPRLTLISLKHPLNNVRVRDDEGNELAVETPQAELEFPVQEGSHTTQFELNLTPAPRSALQLSSVAGTIYALLATNVHEFQFDQLATAKNVEQRFGEATVALESVRKNQDVWEVRIIVRFDQATPALESHRGWIFNNRAILTGPDNTVLVPATMETTRRTEQEVGLSYVFDLPEGPEGWTFSYRTATAVRSLPLSYELRDVELP